MCPTPRRTEKAPVTCTQRRACPPPPSFACASTCEHAPPNDAKVSNNSLASAHAGRRASRNRSQCDPHHPIAMWHEAIYCPHPRGDANKGLGGATGRTPPPAKRRDGENAFFCGKLARGVAGRKQWRHHVPTPRGNTLTRGIIFKARQTARLPCIPVKVALPETSTETAQKKSGTARGPRGSREAVVRFRRAAACFSRVRVCFRQWWRACASCAAVSSCEMLSQTEWLTNACLFQDGCRALKSQK